MIDQASLKAAVASFTSLAKVLDASVVSHDGLILTSTSKDEDINDIVGAMSSELVAKGKQSCRELMLGDLWGNLLFGTQGAILTRVINEEMVLLVRVDPSANLGEIYGKMNLTVRKLAVD